MIQANEIRVGNHLKTDKGKFIKVHSIDKDGININVLDGYFDSLMVCEAYFERGDHRERILEPILLTPDLLLKNGFHGIDSETYFSLPIKNSAYEIYVSLKEDIWGMAGIQVATNDGESGFTGIKTTFLHLHHLQNIYYYASNGKELTIIL